ncbi:hypothetical protein [Agromyces luteolus]|uniref:Uncharacterized protein n=1 Tax=Agromyces luteolus TaxID=88373 RepID=A0A7C9HS58_9MICO|nr:hypothetical protein [Agromyces luteolus]MUN05705.1 hypothetical protein [Agromyces luteolus]
MRDDTPPADLARTTAAISAAADRFVGVNSYEHLLVHLLDLLESGRVDRESALAEFDRLASDWPPGAAEALEFTMHRLRWPEVRRTLEDHRQHGTDFRTRDLAAQVLEAFDDEWPAGDIYRTYREVG